MKLVNIKSIKEVVNIKELQTNDLIATALEVAARAHQGQMRKGKKKPYIVHPVEAALTLKDYDVDDEVIAATLLHDTLEDTEVTEEELKDKFNQRVVDLVLGASEELEDRDNRPWEERKKYTIDDLKNASRDIQYISCADKLSNLRSMIRDYDRLGEELWTRFKRGYKKQSWYYNNLVDSLAALEGVELYEQFKLAVDHLFDSTS